MPAKLSHKQYVDRVWRIHGNRISVHGRYITSGQPLAHKCSACEEIWYPRPRDVVFKRSGCECQRRRKRLSYSSAGYARAVRRTSNGTIRVLDDFAGFKKCIQHLCLKCAHVWAPAPSNVLRGHGCPPCSRNASRSRYKQVTVGGRKFQVQGFEGIALEVLAQEGYKLQRIAATPAEGKPVVSYELDDRLHSYLPDFYYPPKNEVIEVKSFASLELHAAGKVYEGAFERARAKALACLAKRFRFRLMLMHRGQLIYIPDTWVEHSRLMMREWIHQTTNETLR